MRTDVALPAQRARIRHESTVDTPELRAAAAAGDQEAFAKLYRLYRPVVHQYVMRRCGGNRLLAEDLTSDTFERALKRLRRPDSWHEQGRDFGAWLVTIAGNLLADHWKSYRVRKVMPYGGELAEFVATIATADVDVESEVIDRVTTPYWSARLRAAMAALTDLQRRVLYLRYFEGLSVRDTALKLEADEGAVKALTYRAIRTLARNSEIQALRPEVTGG